MKEGWEYKKLGEVCCSDLGKTLNKSKDKGKPYPYLCAINIQWDAIDLSNLKEALFEESEIEKYSVVRGDLLVCEGGDIGRSAIWDEPYSMLYQNALHRIRFKEDMNARFCMFYLWFLKNNNILDTRYGKGVTIKHLVKSALLSIPIPLPPLSTQQSIVAELDKINEIIDLKKAQLKDLDLLAQSIFYDMFGDPIENSKGWEVKKLGEVSTQKLSYGSGASATSYNGTVRYIRITDIDDNGDLKDELVSPNIYDAKYELADGDILFARSGATVGKTFLYHKEIGKCIYAGYLIKMVPDKEIVTPLYVYHFTKTKYYKDFISLSQNAVAQPNINAKQYGDLLICIPPLSLQQSFASKIQAIESQKSAIKQSLADVETLLASRMDYWFGQ